jgi:hypothetical protein
MQNKFIDFDVFINNNKDKICTQNQKELSLLLDDEEVIDLSNCEDMYQLQGIENTSKAIIKHVGKCKVRPTMKLLDFQFKNHTCQVVAYVLNDADIELANTKFFMNIISIHIIKDGVTKGIISLEFHTHEHVKKNKHEITGIFPIYLKTLDTQTNITNKKFIDCLKIFPTKCNLIHILVEYFSNEHISSLFS